MADDRSRLEKLVGMLASNNENEALVALRKIRNLAADQKKTLPELLLTGKKEIVYLDKIVYREREAKPHQPFNPPRKQRQHNGWDEAFETGPDWEPPKDDRLDRALLDELDDAYKAALGTDWLDFNQMDFASTAPFKYRWDWELTSAQKRFAKVIIKRVRTGDAEPLC